ncbi:hypothetical protein CR513_10199, partial [Mucuna pruriens]
MGEVSRPQNINGKVMETSKDGDGGGAHDDIDKTIDKGDGVAIAPCPQPKVVVGVLDNARIFGHNFLDVNSMDDDIVHVLHGETIAILDLDVRTTTINGLVGGNQELLHQFNDHAMLEYNPQWALLDNGEIESSQLGIHHVVVRVVGDHTNVICPVVMLLLRDDIFCSRCFRTCKKVISSFIKTDQCSLMEFYSYFS